MAVSIDERVVEMRFNNKQFEEGVKKSMKSLDDLDESINKLDEAGLSDLQKSLDKMDFSKMEKSLEKIEKKFSGFGVVGATVIQDLTRKVEELGAKLLKSVTAPFEQIKKGGWSRAMNIEDAKFQLKGLDVEWKQIEKDISYGVKDTAFGLDAAAKAASQLVASGVEFGETFGEDGNSPMAKALRGISGVAAMTNSSYEEISSIFTTVAGQGKLMTMQLRQLEARGLNAAATIAEVLGVSEGQLRDMVTQGVIDFQTFSEAMDDAFGQHAKDANETFAGSLANIKSALSRIGADVATEAIQDMVGVFNDVRKMVDNIHIALEPLIEETKKWVAIGTSAMQIVIRWLDNDKQHRLATFISILGDGITNVTQALSEIILFFLLHGKPIINALSDIADGIGEVLGLIFSTVNSADPLKMIISVVITGLKVIVILLRAMIVTIKSIAGLILDSGILEKIFSLLAPIASVVLPAIAAYLLLTKLHLIKVAAVIAVLAGVISGIVAFDLIGKIKSAAEWLKTLGLTIFDWVTNPLKKTKDEVKETLSWTDKMKGSFASVGGAMTKMLPTTVKLSMVFDNLKAALAGFVGGIKPSRVLIIGLGAAFSYTLIAISNAITAVSRVIRSLNPFAVITEAADGIRLFLIKAGKAELIKSAAIAIGILAASISALAITAGYLSQKVNPGTFMVICAGMAAIGAGLAFLVTQIGKVIPANALSILMSYVGTAINKVALTGMLASLAGVFLALAAFVFTVSKCMKGMDRGIKNLIKFRETSKFILDLIATVGIMAGALMIVARVIGPVFASGVLMSLSVFFLAIAEALNIYSRALSKLGKIQMNGDLGKAMVLYLVGLVSVVAGAALLFAVFSKQIAGVSATVLGVVATLGLTLIALWSLPKIIISMGLAIRAAGDAFKDVTVKQILGIVASMKGMAVAISVAVITISRLARPIVGVMATMLGFVASVIILLEVLSRINNDKFVKIRDLLPDLTFLMGTLAGCMALIITAAGHAQHAAKAAILLISIPISLLGFITACWILKNAVLALDPQEWGALLIGLTGFIMAFVGFLWAAEKIPPNGLGTMLSLTAVMVGLAIALGGLTWIIHDFGIWKVLGALGVLVTAMAGFVFAISKVTSSISAMDISKTIVAVGSMAGLLIAVATAMAILISMKADWISMIAAGAAISLVMAAMIGMMQAALRLETVATNFDKTKLLSIAGSILAVSSSMLLIAVAISQLTGINWQDLLKAAGSLVAIVAILGVGISALSQLRLTPGSMFELGLSLTAVSLGMTALAFGISKLAEAPIAGLIVAAGALEMITLASTAAIAVLSAFPEAAAIAIPVAAALAIHMISIGAAALALAGALWLVTDALTKLVDIKDDLAETMSALGQGIGGAISGFFAGLVNGVGRILNSLTKVATKFLNGITKIFITFTTNISKIKASFMTRAIATTTVFLGSMLDLLKNFIVGIGYSIRSGLTGLWHVAIEGEDIGKYVGFALTKGMLEGAGDVFDAGVKLADAGMDGYKKESEMHSPPKKWIEIGQYVTKALATGMVGGPVAGAFMSKSIAWKAGEWLAKASGEGFKKAFGPVTVSAAEKTKEGAEVVVEETVTAAEETVDEKSPGLIETVSDAVSKVAGTAEEGKKSWLDGLLGWFEGTEADNIVTKAKDFCTKLYEDSGISQLKDTLTNWNIFDQQDEWSSYKAKVEFTQPYIDRRNQNSKLFRDKHKQWNDILYGVADDKELKKYSDGLKAYYKKRWDETYKEPYDENSKLFKEVSKRWTKQYDRKFRKKYDYWTEEQFKQATNELTWKQLEHDKKFQKKVNKAMGDSTDALKNYMKQTVDNYEEDKDWEEYWKQMTEGATNFGDASGEAGDGVSYLAERLSALDFAFSRFDNTISVKAKDLTKNVQSNVKGLKDWEKGIKNLIARGASADLIDKFVQMGWQSSYSYVAALNNASDKDFNKFQKQLKESMGVSEDTAKFINKCFVEVGEDAAAQYNKAVTKTLKYDKKYKMKKKDWTQITGKELKKGYRKAFGKLDLSDVFNVSKASAEAIDRYMSVTTSKSKEATKAYNDYIQEMYMATLSQEELQNFMMLSAKKKTKLVTKWYKEEQKAIRESTRDQIQSMGDLNSAYVQTGEEMLKEMQKKTDDYIESGYNRMYAYGLLLKYGYKEEADYIKENFSDEQYMSLLQGYDSVVRKQGEDAGKAWIDGFVSLLNGAQADHEFDDDETVFGMLLTKYDLDKNKDVTGISEFLDSISDKKTQFKSTEEILIQYLKSIKDNVKGVINSADDRVMSRIAKNMSKAFTSLGNVDQLEVAKHALEEYAMTFIDVEEIRAEAAEKGIDVEEAVKARLESISDAMKNWRNDVESNLKGALQSFNKFEEGESMSLSEMEANLRNNVTKLNEWRAMIKRMRELGYSKDLIEYMSSQGISSYADVKTLTEGNVLSADVDQINQMWEQIGNDASIAADESLGAVALAAGDSGRRVIDETIKASEDQLAKDQVILDNAVKKTGETTAKAIESTAPIYKQAVANLYTMIAKEVDDKQTKINEITTGKMKVAKQLLSKGMTLDQVNKAFKIAGIDSVEGYVDGLTSYNAKKLKDSGINQFAFSIINEFMKSLDINSPSKKFKWIGEMCVEGLAMGFRDSSYSVENELGDLEDVLLDYARTMLDDIDNSVNEDSEWTIKPVLDLDNLQNAQSDIQSLLGNGDIAVRSGELASQTTSQSGWNMLSKALSGISSNETNNTYGDTTIVVNPPQGSNSREIAQMVMGEIQRQMDRRQRI